VGRDRRRVSPSDRVSIRTESSSHYTYTRSRSLTSCSPPSSVSLPLQLRGQCRPDSPPLPTGFRPAVPLTPRFPTPSPPQIESTIWPRAAAAAERWWSYDVTGNDFTAAGVAERFSWFRCQMLDNGVASAPTNNANAREGPPGPGSCFAQ
jgi:hypothetical protein